MQLKVVGSGSSGNLYILETEHEALVIEAGVHLKELKKAMNFNLSKIAGVLISHQHGDHAKYAASYKMNGLGVLDEFSGKVVVGGFKVIPFEVVHDVKTYGFLIHHEEMGTTCYISDTHYVPVKMKGLNNMLIECNYCQQILDGNIAMGTVPAMLRERIIESHMELQTVKGVMRANDLSKVNNIVLLHLSNANSDAERFKREIGQLTGKRVTIAEAGLVMDFNKEF